MGGIVSQTCLHSKIKLINSQILNHKHLGEWIHCIDMNQCDDCGEIWNEETFKDSLLGHTSSSTKIYPETRLNKKPNH